MWGNLVSLFVQFGGVTLFNSMYEIFNALTTVNPQHFVYYFSGKDIASIWTKTNHTGSGSVTTDDSADSGCVITTGANTNDDTSINLNDKRQFKHDGCVLIWTEKRNETSSNNPRSGLKETANATFGGMSMALVHSGSEQSFIRLQTCDGTTVSGTDTDVVPDANTRVLKIECSADDIKLYLDGVLKVTKTTNRPIGKMQPMFYIYTSTTAAKKLFIKQCEAYNTTQLSSFYEKLTPLTTIQKLRHRTDFVGKGLDTNIWEYTNISNTTSQIQDAADGGIEIATNDTANASGIISHNNKRQFAHDSSEILIILKSSTTEASTIQTWGLSDTGLTNPRAASTNSALISDVVNQGFYYLETADTATASGTASDVAVDTNYHKAKIICGGSDIKLYIDGVLKVTKTTNRPTAKMQPVMYVNSDAIKTVSMKMIEARHTETGTFDFIDSLFNLATTVSKLHFWEWFVGNDINTTIWNKRDLAGTNTYAMSDVADEGYKVLTDGGSGSQAVLDFNNKRQFAHDNSVIIGIVKTVTTSNFAVHAGLRSDASVSVGTNNFETAAYFYSFAQSNIALKTGDASASSITESDVAKDTNFHSFKIVCSGTDIKLYIDGVLKITKTTNRPTVKLQPWINVFADDAVAKDLRIKYLEVRNT